jgi:hypothetical protein
MNEIEIRILKTIIKYYGEILASLKKNPVGFAAEFKESVENTVRYAETVLDFDAKYKADPQHNGIYLKRARNGLYYIQQHLPVNINFPKS